MYTNFFRVFKFGWQEFLRNIGVSIGTVFVMFIALSLLAGTIFLKGATDNLISILKEKIDISVYFNLDVKEEEILKIQERIENFPEVKGVEYVSREKALEIFKQRHKDNPQIMGALTEIGENPLPASLNIKAASASAYEALSNFLEKGEFKNLIEKVNFRQNQPIIERLFSISSMIKRIGITGSLLLIFIALVVTFNTIRIAIYSKREEIKIMKLIGATNWFVRGPFLVQGILVGLFAGIFSFLLFWGSDVLFLSESGIFRELGLLNFFEKNILLLFLVQVLGGILLGILSSFFAAQKHLKI